MKETLESLLQKHGLRPVVNALAGILQEKGKKGETIPYGDGTEVDSGDLLTAAGNLYEENLF